jgi:hypothetical protein
MKYKGTICLKIMLLMLMIALSACYKQKKAGDNFEDNLSNGFYVFKGAIDDNDGLVMAIYIDSNKLYGYYFHDSSGVKHNVSGTIDDDNFLIEEKGNDGKLKASFSARLHDKERLKGAFKNTENLTQGVFKAKLVELSKEGNSAYISQLNLFKESTYSPNVTIPKIVLEEGRVADRINKQLDLKSVTGISFEDIQAEVVKSEAHHGMLHGIISSDFAQKYNRENILCLRVVNQFLTNNHSTVVKFYTFDLKTGDQIMGKDLLNPYTTKDLLALCNTLLQDHIARKITEISAEEYAQNRFLFKNHKFGLEHIDAFYIEESTIVFCYDFNFPRDKQDLAPNAELTFSFDEIKKYLNKRGPLRFMFEERAYKKRKNGRI